MDAGLKLINNDLNDALYKLLNDDSTGADTALEQRKQKIAMLIKLHVRHVQQTVITNRRRRQQRSRRRFKQLRSFFMQQMIELQSRYLHMFAMLRMKHAQLDSGQLEDTQPYPDIHDDPHRDQAESHYVTGNQTQFWEDTIPQYSDEEFLSSLHVTRSTFKSLCSQLAPTLRTVPELTSAHLDKISAEKCVGLALYFLASGERISIISEQFALPRARTIKCLKVFCNAVMTNLGKALRLLPQSEADCENVVAGFQRECNMPAALVGVLGVCCIPLRGKGKSDADFVPTLRMEFLLDDRMLFRELQLRNGNGIGPRAPTPMFAEPPNPLSQLPARCINGRMVPAFVLAPVNQNYPLRPWLLQQFADPVDPHEYDFNEVADHLHELSDCALHRLMSRWRFLSQPLDISFQTASCIITAATVLHNLLEELSEPHMLEWGNTVDVSRFRSPPIAPKQDISEDVDRALEVRDFLARTISSTEI
ncbi:hypothetical protein ACLKA6_010847 [Drosophila palustris]